MTIAEMRGQYAKLLKQSRDMLDLIDSEKRDMTVDEKTKYDAIWVDVEKTRDKIQAEERQQQAETAAAAFTDDSGIRNEPEQTEAKPETRSDVHWSDTKEYRDAFYGWMAGNVPEAEIRALQMDVDSAGGYTVLPQSFQNSLIEKKKDMVWVRQRATVYSIPKAGSLGAPALDTEPADITWTGEITTRTEDSTMAFGKRELYPTPMAKLLKVSKKLLRASAFNMEALVRDRLAYKSAVTEENAFLNGTGANQPLGVFTANDNGISTDRDMSTGNTETTIEADNLFNQKYNLKMQYRANAAWCFHRDGIKMVAKLKDGEGRYLLVPDMRSGSNLDRLLGYPVYESEYAPSTFTTGLYVGILGDFTYYWIADALNMSVQRLVELYAATAQDGFIITSETDGMPVLEEAFSRVTLG